MARKPLFISFCGWVSLGCIGITIGVPLFEPVTGIRVPRTVWLGLIFMAFWPLASIFWCVGTQFRPHGRPGQWQRPANEGLPCVPGLRDGSAPSLPTARQSKSRYTVAVGIGQTFSGEQPCRLYQQENTQALARRVISLPSLSLPLRTEHAPYCTGVASVACRRFHASSRVSLSDQ